MPPILEIENLTKSFSDVKAVQGVSLRIQEGICFGLLGPNGAGKTTTIEIMEGITEASGGKVLYRGDKISDTFYHKIGIQFQATSLQDFLTVKETLTMFSKLYSKTIEMDELIRICTLEEFIHRDNRKLSGGQRQRLLLAIALVNDPEIVFLDEPTTGLDPQSRRNFWTLINKIKSQGKTIVLTTHYMDEAQILCDHIAIMDKGKIIANDTPENLLKNHFGDFIIQLPKTEIITPIENIGINTTIRNEIAEFQTHDLDDALKKLINAGISLKHMNLRTWNLEDLFLSLTGEELRL